MRIGINWHSQIRYTAAREGYYLLCFIPAFSSRGGIHPFSDVQGMFCKDLAGALVKICYVSRLISFLLITPAMADISDGIIGQRNSEEILNIGFVFNLQTNFKQNLSGLSPKINICNIVVVLSLKEFFDNSLSPY